MTLLGIPSMNLGKAIAIGLALAGATVLVTGTNPEREEPGAGNPHAGFCWGLSRQLGDLLPGGRK